MSQNHVFQTAHGSRLRQSLAVRHIGRYDDVEDAESEPVAFLTTQHITLHHQSHMAALNDNQQVLTLSQSRQEYVVDSNHVHSHVGENMRQWPKDQVLHVSECWYLVVGSGIT